MNHIGSSPVSHFSVIYLIVPVMEAHPYCLLNYYSTNIMGNYQNTYRRDRDDFCNMELALGKA